jgi:GNAT superfamily N-acetyltransferase
MGLEIRPVGESDINQFTLTAIEAFQTGIGHLLTGTNTPENVTKKNEATLKTIRAQSGAKLIQVVDTETGEMIAGSMWDVYATEQTEEQLDKTLAKPTLEQGYKPEFEPLYEHLKGNRRRIMGTRPYIYLDVLFTHPRHHRRGAGAMMVKYGVDLADELGIEAYHESSVEGRALYERFGYKVLKAVEFPMADYGRPDLGVDLNCLMHREARSKRQD